MYTIAQVHACMYTSMIACQHARTHARTHAHTHTHRLDQINFCQTADYKDKETHRHNIHVGSHISYAIILCSHGKTRITSHYNVACSHVIRVSLIIRDLMQSCDLLFELYILSINILCDSSHLNRFGFVNQKICIFN